MPDEPADGAPAPGAPPTDASIETPPGTAAPAHAKQTGPRQSDARQTSAKRARANRQNAGRSTGPRSAAGKARSASNAVRHGLAVPVSGDSALVPEIARLAQRLACERADKGAEDGEENGAGQGTGHGAGDGTGIAGDDAALRGCAEAAAEAHLDLVRIRRIRRRLLDALEAAIAPGTAPERVVEPQPMFPLPATIEAVIAAAYRTLDPMLRRLIERKPAPRGIAASLLDELARLERYERRAFSRRKRALRALAEVLPQAGPAAPT